MLASRLLVAFFLLLPLPAAAAEIDVPSEPGALASAIAGAEEGDILLLRPGTHPGNFIIDRTLTLDGGGAAHLEGPGTGTVLTIDAPGAVVRGLLVTGSGSSHEEIDSGIKLTQQATGARVERNVLLDNLYGIDIHGAESAVVVGNVIDGRQGHRMNERGNGVYIWNAAGAVVEGNDIRWGRDGIFVNTSMRNILRDNRFRDLRFAIHLMYSNGSEIVDNLSIGNHLGFALMFSKRLTVIGNRSIGDREHGIMLNYANEALIEGNLVTGGPDGRGPEKCVFIYNAHKNRLVGNRFEGCEIGIHFTAGSERNAITGNAFIGNRTQVKYVGTIWIDWSADGVGNYWSDHPAYDLDGDGFADADYKPNDLMDQVLWSQPATKLLLGSPAVQLVRWSQATFPALLPGGVVDTRPLMRPVEIPDAEWVLR
nr:nitrous oxide reductase maturation protein [uncultured bacterium]